MSKFFPNDYPPVGRFFPMQDKIKLLKANIAELETFEWYSAATGKWLGDKCRMLMPLMNDSERESIQKSMNDVRLTIIGILEREVNDIENLLKSGAND